MTNLFCLFGFHHYETAYAPMRMRCARCGHDTPGWADTQDIPGATVRYTGYLSTAEVRRLRRRGVHPAYVTPQVEAELEAAAVAAKARKRRGPAEVTAMRRSA